MQILLENNKQVEPDHEKWPEYFTITITIVASLKFSEILAATFSATWLGLQERGKFSASGEFDFPESVSVQLSVP